MKTIEDIWDVSKNQFKIQQIKEEWLWLLKRLPAKSNILEIGCYDGGSTYSLANYANMLVTIDINNPPRFDVNNIKEVCPRYMYIGMNSRNPDILRHIKDYTFDVIFIDGDHSYEGVAKDYQIYRQFLAPGGMIVFHDIVDSDNHRRQHCFVSKFWNEIKSNKRSEEITTTDWGGIGIVYE
jgi:predicted O-methyltransferase YrrM